MAGLDELQVLSGLLAIAILPSRLCIPGSWKVGDGNIISGGRYGIRLSNSHVLLFLVSAMAIQSSCRACALQFLL